ncbi:hypothetical protein PoB_001292300 [Plakobranchus ocellatus]|uniref:Uncharacterized protein n=1 Tax=Plakobranchus ocellatus TaxID=259542 RepID=A0AAV3YV28_9GAST|nr:hypothetical protein PoB_001292300 [Plakobranchus ocellatus]
MRKGNVAMEASSARKTSWYTKRPVSSTCPIRNCPSNPVDIKKHVLEQLHLQAFFNLRRNGTTLLEERMHNLDFFISTSGHNVSKAKPADEAKVNQAEEAKEDKVVEDVDIKREKEDKVVEEVDSKKEKRTELAQEVAGSDERCPATEGESPMKFELMLDLREEEGPQRIN